MDFLKWLWNRLDTDTKIFWFVIIYIIVGTVTFVISKPVGLVVMAIAILLIIFGVFYAIFCAIRSLKAEYDYEKLRFEQYLLQNQPDIK